MGKRTISHDIYIMMQAKLACGLMDEFDYSDAEDADIVAKHSKEVADAILKINETEVSRPTLTRNG